MDAAEACGELLRGYFKRPLDIRQKQLNDLVTEADEAIEARLVNHIREAFPNDAIFAEEGGEKTGTTAYQWIIDPVDGTTNFAHQLPQFSISIALAYEGKVIAGVVNDPVKEEFFEAELGSGAKLNGEPISVASRTRLADALVVTGFSYDRRDRIEVLLERVRRILMNAQGLRRFGSAALDLCYIAAGRFDVFVEDGLSPWDMAAGQLIAAEAGAALRTIQGEPFDVFGNGVVACNPDLIEEALEKLCHGL
jgi:myo-inositol-1(or 4)-monophosphatase